MNQRELAQKAKELADRSYITLVRYEPEGMGIPDYIALHPELPGCMAQGVTAAAAIAELANVRLFWIESLLEDGLPVPEPQPLGGVLVEAARSNRLEPVETVAVEMGNLRLQPV